jgi:alanyl-tRNA synthetase
MKDELRQLAEVRELVKSKDAAKMVTELIAKNLRLEKEIEEMIHEKAMRLKQELKTHVEHINGIDVITSRIELPPAAIKDLAFQLRNEVENLFAVFGSVAAGKPHLACVISDKLVKEHGMNASDIIRTLAVEIKGGGGGQAFFATAGGTEISGLDKALISAKKFISEK